MENVKEEIQLLKDRISDLELQLLNRTRLENRSKSLLIGLYRPIRFDFIKKILKSIPNPLSLRESLNESFISNPKSRFDKFHVEFLNELPALEIRKIIKEQKVELEIDFDARYTRANVQELLKRQSVIMEKVLAEQKERIKEDLNKKYQIGGKFRRGNTNTKNNN